MLPVVFCIIPTIVGAAMMIGLNDSGQKGALLFGEFISYFPRDLPNAHLYPIATYLIGTFGSALSSVYAYNASNTSGHTKKVSGVLATARLIFKYRLAEHGQRTHPRDVQCRQHSGDGNLPAQGCP